MTTVDEQPPVNKQPPGRSIHHNNRGRIMYLHRRFWEASHDRRRLPGKQLTAQPVFAKSDQQFKGLETLFSASIAADRGGNERGVNVAKRCGYIKRGFLPGMDARTFNDVWLCWSFQANFCTVQFYKHLKGYVETIRFIL